MLTKILAASTLVFGMAASTAMAQSVSDGPDVTVDPTMEESIDTGTTESIYSDTMPDTLGSSGAVSTGTLGPCASAPGTLGPDANSGLNVNDQYCGK
jgi:hypothetical protein